MEQIKLRAEAAINSSLDFRKLLLDIEKMGDEDRQIILSAVENLEKEVFIKGRESGKRLRNTVWHMVLNLLTIGLDDMASQALVNQVIGPGINKEIAVARIEEIKRALRSSPTR